jgi:hypothetical protein
MEYLATEVGFLIPICFPGSGTAALHQEVRVKGNEALQRLRLWWGFRSARVYERTDDCRFPEQRGACFQRSDDVGVVHGPGR